MVAVARISFKMCMKLCMAQYSTSHAKAKMFMAGEGTSSSRSSSSGQQQHQQFKTTV
jgi:hypothetical protein